MAVLPSCENASRHIISGRVFAASAAIVSLFCRRRSLLIFRNPCSRSPVSMSPPGVFCAMAGTTRCRNASSISIRDLANGFGVTRRSTGLVASIAGHVAREDRDRRVAILVVAEHEEGDARGRILNADAAAGKRRVVDLADAHAGGDIGRRGAEHDELGAAMVDEMVQRQHADARRFEAHLQIAGDRTWWPCGCRRKPDVDAVTVTRAGPDLRFGRACLPIGLMTKIRLAESCFTSPAGCCARIGGEHRGRLAILFEYGLDARERAAGRLDGKLELRVLADIFFRRPQCYDRAWQRAGVKIGGAASQTADDHEKQQSSNEESHHRDHRTISLDHGIYFTGSTSQAALQRVPSQAFLHKVPFTGFHWVPAH